jgi:hypothetical protein
MVNLGYLIFPRFYFECCLRWIHHRDCLFALLNLIYDIPDALHAVKNILVV